MKCFLDYAQGAFGKLVSREVAAAHPLDAADIIGGVELSTHHFTQEVDQHVVVFGLAVAVAHDAFENFEDAQRLDLQSGFFADLALDRLPEKLTSFDEPAGQGPVAFKRLASAFDEKNRIATKNERADAEQRVATTLQAANEQLKRERDAAELDLRANLPAVSATLASRILGVEINVSPATR